MLFYLLKKIYLNTEHNDNKYPSKLVFILLKGLFGI